MRDPGNFGELAMITLPKYVQARFVILGNVKVPMKYIKNDLIIIFYVHVIRNRQLYGQRLFEI